VFTLCLFWARKTEAVICRTKDMGTLTKGEKWNVSVVRVCGFCKVKVENCGLLTKREHGED
jgi:hypothetical protein